MALSFDNDKKDELSRLLKDPSRDNRRDIWLWLWLDRHHSAHFDSASCSSSAMRETIAAFLRSQKSILELINAAKAKSLLPTNTLKWIKGGERQHAWLLNRLEMLIDSWPTPSLARGLVHLTEKNYLIAMLDIWDIDIAKKAVKVEQLRQEWMRHKANDSEFAWFDDEKTSAQRCQCAWEWLVKNHTPLETNQLPISSYEDLLIFFDKENLAPYMQKTIIQQIKRKWSRKQFDERSSDKKQLNVMLSKSVIKQLDQLATKHELKRAQVIELLITKEANQTTIKKG
jgi:hypothetical protein